MNNLHLVSSKKVFAQDRNYPLPSMLYTTVLWMMFSLSIITIGIIIIRFPYIEKDVSGIAFLPLAYAACFFLMISKRKHNLIHLLIYVFYSIQFLVIPILLAFAGRYDFSVYNPAIIKRVDMAVLLQCFVLCVLSLYMHYSQWTVSIVGKSTSVFSYSKKTVLLLLILVFIGIGLIARYPQFIYKFRLVVIGDSQDYFGYLAKSETVKQSMPLLVYHFGLWYIEIMKLLALYLVLIAIRAVCKHLELLGVLLSLVVILASCIITTEDKAITIFYAICYCLWLAKAYPSQLRRIAVLGCFGSIILILMVFVILPSGSSSGGYFVSSLLSKCNAYFNGTINVAGSLEMPTDDLARSFVGDIFRSIPMVNSLFKSYPMSYLVFNVTLGVDTEYYSEIIPIIGQGHYYLGFVGAALLPLLQLWVIKLMAKRMERSHSDFSFLCWSVGFLIYLFGLFLYDFFLTSCQFLNYALPALAVSLLISDRRKKNV